MHTSNDLTDLVPLIARLPTDRPFTTEEVRVVGVTWRQLRRLTEERLVRHQVRGVYVSSGLSDGLSLRIAILRMVVPEAGVVTDRTAAWLWGATTALAPNDHLVVPKVSVFCPPGHRLRNGLTNSGERHFSPGDVVELDGVRVSSPLRTACDLGRLLHRDQAFAAMDALAALGHFTVEELLAAAGRFKHYRGIVQFRALAPYVDPGSQSPGESILRLRWLDVGLPRPTCQIEVDAPGGGSYLLDMGLPDLGYAAEYDGEDFHGEEQREHDRERRAWARRHGGWRIVVARKQNIHGRHQDIDQLLRRGMDATLRHLARR